MTWRSVKRASSLLARRIAYSKACCAFSLKSTGTSKCCVAITIAFLSEFSPCGPALFRAIWERGGLPTAPPVALPEGALSGVPGTYAGHARPARGAAGRHGAAPGAASGPALARGVRMSSAPPHPHGPREQGGRVHAPCAAHTLDSAPPCERGHAGAQPGSVACRPSLDPHGGPLVSRTAPVPQQLDLVKRGICGTVSSTVRACGQCA